MRTVVRRLVQCLIFHLFPVVLFHVSQVAEVIEAAKRAKEAGSTRFCMGAAWRELGNKKKAFNNILDMVGAMPDAAVVCVSLQVAS